jgi:hypothetical protein
MRIDSYSFGRIVIDGKIFTKDVIIFSGTPGRVLSPWWRKEGHFLALEDLDEVLREKPEILVIGKGYSGVMEVPDAVIHDLAIEGIRVIVKDSSEAVGVFSTLKSPKKAAALHLTC